MRKISWFDVRTKFKKIIRSFFYTSLVQEIICCLIASYIRLVHCTSKKIIIGHEQVMERFKNKQPALLVTWHNRIMMSPFVPATIRKFNKIDKISALASKHGDGRFIGGVIKKFGANIVLGSSKSGRKASRGIDMHGLKEIIRSFKNGLGISITPDGPRGPVHKINGEVVKIAKLTSAPIVPLGIGYSKFFSLNTWDKLRIPLPFGVVCYCYGDFFWADKNVKEEDIPGLNMLLEEKMNLATKNADDAAARNN
jgi:lysophospholipid acyltransferase (LPLAT)-like uncharacterized protein